MAKRSFEKVLVTKLFDTLLYILMNFLYTILTFKPSSVSQQSDLGDPVLHNFDVKSKNDYLK